MADEPSKESSLFPSSDGVREDSGLQDILSVSKQIKNKSETDPLAEDGGDDSPGDSGMIVFSAGESDSGPADDDDAVFGSFTGRLGAGFGSPLDPPASSAADLTPLASGSGRVTEATRPAEVAAQPQPEQKRSPLLAVAVVLGLVLVGGAAVMLTQDKGDSSKTEPVAQAGMSAPEDEAAVGKAEEPVDPAGATAGATAGVAPEPVPEPEPAPLEGETEGLGALDPDGGDPMAMKNGLLENDGTNGVTKNGKWDQGTSYAKPDKAPADAEDDPDPLPQPKPDKQPKGESIKGGAETGNEEVDCLLNPDLPKCQGGGDTKPKNTEVLQPKIPDKLSSSQLREGFNSIKSAAKKCGQQHGAEAGTQVKVHVSIEGASGKVTDVKATGEYAGTPLGDCVADAVKNAQFEVFKNPSQGADYPIVM